jgi:NADH-quinone oxidoreductase subunit L
MITGIYSFRLVFVVFFGRDCPIVQRRLGWRMSVPLILFCVLAVSGGMLRIPLDTVFPEILNPEHGVNLVSGITAAVPFIGLLIAALFYLTGTFSARRLSDFAWANQLRLFWLNGWGMDTLYDRLMLRPFKTIVRLNKDDTVDGIYSAITWLSREGHLMLGASQTGRIRWYASSMALGAVVIIAIGWLS